MELSKQCVSLDIAKRLKELGCKQESLFDWISWGADKSRVIYAAMDHQWTVELTGYYSAYTVAELGELPLDLRLEFHVEPTIDGWQGMKRHEDRFVGIMPTMAKTQADSWGLLWIYLIENSLVDVKDL